MNINVTALKNYLSVLKSRGLSILEFNDTKEKNDFIESFEKAIESIENEIETLDFRIDRLEKNGNVPKNKSANTFVDVVLNRIEILKNIIKSKMGKPEDELFSFNLTTVESIEEEIRQNNTVTRGNLEKLNKIYMAELNQI